MGSFKVLINIFILLLFPTILINGSAVKKVIEEIRKVPIQIPGYSPDISDDYVAFPVNAPNGYIVKFEPLSLAERVHHMILFGCESLPSTEPIFKGHSTCGVGTSKIIYAWARNAPSLDLPKDVAFAIGSTSNNINFLVLQIHYADPFQGNVKDYSGLLISITQQQPLYLADVYLFAGISPIPPRRDAYYSNMSCEYTGSTQLHPFAFRTHTHKMGRVVSAFYKHDNQWTKIGKRNPQWPQLFEKIDRPLKIETGDLLAATCRYDSSNETTQTNMGHMGKDEMCNFYMMFYRDINDPEPFPYGSGCSSQIRYNEMLKEYPSEGLTLLPPNPRLEAIAAPTKTKFGVLEKNVINGIGDIKFGQISGLAFDNKNDLVVFHRGSRQWDAYSFSYDNTFTDKRPIPEPTIIVMKDSQNHYKLVQTLGENMFYMPHGIFIDESNYYYVTDVGSHQMHKMKINDGKLEILFSIGEKFVPGSDREHLCKPSGVAVSRQDGSIYISDGYCNNRILKFTKDGRFVAEFGIGGGNDRESYAPLGSFNLPHDITLNEDKNQLYVADRENGRVQVFTTAGVPLYDIKNPNLFGNVYSAHYCSDHGLVLIPGVAGFNGQVINAYVVPTNSTRIQYSFAPMEKSFSRPHIIRMKGDFIYIGEISSDGGKLWKFEIESDHLLRQSTTSSEFMLSEYPSTEISSIHKETIPKSSSGTLLFGLISFAIIIAAYFGYKTLKVRERNSTTGMNFFDRQSFQPLKTTDDMTDSEDDLNE
uniref:Peptidylglycine monooxygenase n=1 Tax=Parastrongyloides trichosuri TaxID=131310 RepID=A0A0N5A2F7_PARTI